MNIKARQTLRILSLFFILISGSAVFALPIQDCSDPTVSQLVLKAKKELSDRLYLTLASANLIGSPWNTPVYTGFDAHYHFFWISEKTSQHSRNIRQNNRTFAVFYDSTAPEGTGFGVYLQGHAYELNDRQGIAYGLNLIATRAGVPPPPTGDYQGAFPERIYTFVPRKIWVNTVVELDGQFVDKRIELTGCMLNHASALANAPS